MPENIHVLIVDDEKPFRENMVKLLGVHGVGATAVEHGEAALDATKQRDFDVILLDLRMPGLDGVQTFKKLQAQGCKAPVIFLTGHGTLDDEMAGLHLGAFEYLHKPCPTEELLEKVTAAVERSRDKTRLLSKT